MEPNGLLNPEFDFMVLLVRGEFCRLFNNEIGPDGVQKIAGALVENTTVQILECVPMCLV
jgi:hypothetical protein